MSFVANAAVPLQDNLFEWHFSVRGPPDSDFDGGVYHGRIVLPPEYPMKPPSIILLTVRRPTADPHHPPQCPPPGVSRLASR